ncbi:MAG: hemerythrin domain-containing protein [Rhodoferax sp.]|uniref:hemerythrin domain-containing protein n=1 Tax=Rhodoferax sp. TaxID=50421 RepID=UPI003016402A
MNKVPEVLSFEAFDSCHRQIQIHLDELSVIADQVTHQILDPQAIEKVREIELFFSGVSREHHSDEEEDIFPRLMQSGDQALMATVRSLIQDHFWIEKYWLDLEPQLQSLTGASPWPEAGEFQRTVRAFLELCNHHIAVEEALIYPEAKSRLAQCQFERTPYSRTV